MPIQNNAKICKMTETLACEYSSESTQRELSNEYLHDKVYFVFVLWMKVASALEGLKDIWTESWPI